MSTIITSAATDPSISPSSSSTTSQKPSLSASLAAQLGLSSLSQLNQPSFIEEKHASHPTHHAILVDPSTSASSSSITTTTTSICLPTTFDTNPSLLPSPCATERLKWVSPTSADLEELKLRIKEKITRGGGECIFILGAMDDGTSLNFTQEEYTTALGHLRTLASQFNSVVTELCPKAKHHFTSQNLESLSLNNHAFQSVSLSEKEKPPSTTTTTTTTTTTADGGGASLSSTTSPPHTIVSTETYFLIRQSMEVEQLMEVRVAVCGNVDSGKSSLLGVLTKNILDNGRGKARIALFRHPHEVDSGRTSSVGMDIMGFDPTGVQVGVSLTPTPSSVPDSSSLLLHKHTKPTTTSTSTSSVVSGVNYHHHYQHSHLNSEKSRVTWDQITTHSSKLITLFDLAGHEKYLKTTVYGLCGTSPDFSILTIGANMGIVGMTKEHLGLSLALGVPVMIVITKIDMCPTPVLQETVTQLLKIVKSKGCRKLPMFIRNMEDVVKVASLFVSDRICPIFLVSNVTGEGLNYLRQFINLLPLMSQQKYDALKPTECLLSENFSIPGVGTVVSVTVMSGTVHLGDTLYLGPNAQGGYVPTQIKGIHIKYVPVPSVSAGHTATLALKKIKRAVLRKGMVLLAKDSDMIACQEFEAEMLVLSHSTTIHPKYQATLHCLNVRQTATVISIADHTLLRTGDKAVVRFRFVNHPEHLKRGSRLLFREGRTKCIGNVVHVFPFKKETSMLSNERELNGGALTGHGFLTPATSIFALSAKARKQLRKQLNVTDVLDESKFFTSSVVTG